MGVRDIYRNRASLGHLPVLKGQTLIEIPYRLQLDADTVGLWWFNEGSGTVLNDRVATPHNGTISTPTWLTTGPFGTSLRAATVTTPAGGFVGQLAAGTVEVVCCPISTPSESNGMFYVENDYNGNQIFRVDITNANKFGASRINNGTWADLYNANASPVDAWYYIAYVWTATSRVVYINGAAVASDALDGKTSAAVVSRTFYSQSWGSAYHFPGAIATIRTSNVARTANEILANAYLMGLA